jgi:DNA-binding transcriptional LysR family regulator
MMQDLNDLYYFTKAVDHGGFAPAGRALGIPKSKLSRRVANLENRLGLRLIQRTTRHFMLTEIGQAYYEHCKAMLVEADAAQAVIDEMQVEPRGTIRVSCPIALLHVYVGGMLADFMAKYPKIAIHLEATNRRVDIISEAFDLAIRVRPLPLEDTDLKFHILAERRQCLVGHPRLIQAYGPPVSPAELNKFPSLGLGNLHKPRSWDLRGPNNAQARINHTPRFTTTDMIALRNAAVAGVGIVQLPVMMICNQIKDESLVRILPDWAPRAETIHAVFPTRRGLLPSVRALIDYLDERFSVIDEE